MHGLTVVMRQLTFLQFKPDLNRHRNPIPSMLIHVAEVHHSVMIQGSAFHEIAILAELRNARTTHVKACIN